MACKFLSFFSFQILLSGFVALAYFMLTVVPSSSDLVIMENRYIRPLVQAVRPRGVPGSDIYTTMDIRLVVPEHCLQLVERA